MVHGLDPQHGTAFNALPIKDRLLVMSWRELGNGWEDPEVYHDPPELHEAALRMGVNLFVYAVTSRPTP